MDRESFYLGALLHDIGKFVERARDKDRVKKAKIWINEGKTDKYFAHRRYGADFIKEFKKNFINQEDVINLILYHHRGRERNKKDFNRWKDDIYSKMVHIADCLSSSERLRYKYHEHQSPVKAKFLSIFNQIHLDNKTDNCCIDKRCYQYLELKKLTLDKNDIFPDENKKTNSTAEENEYRDLVNFFYKEFEKVKNQTQLFHLLEKYLWAVPAQTPSKKIPYKPDISLFDHLRTTAAIGICLYDDYEKGLLTKDEILKYTKPTNKKIADKNIALLLQCDFSGIQSFIFNIQSKKAARNLKGRSFYLQLLSDIISQYILDKLDLPIANLLYNGGGNFYILAPKSKESELEDIRNKIVTILHDYHKGEIYAAIDWIDIKFKDFKNFTEKWEEVSKKTEKIKSNRFNEIDYERVFEPYIPKKDASKEEDKPEDTSIKWDFKDFTDKIKKADKITICKSNIDNNPSNYIDKIFKEFGYQVSFDNKEENINDKNETTYKLNCTDFLTDNFAGFKFALINLPQDSEFESIANLSKGDRKKLALLKMDVDNLGLIFSEGLKPDEDNETETGRKSISRLATLSRMLRLFFEGYLDTIRKNEKYKDKLYIVYSGGDDTFLLGSFDAVFEVADKIRKDFKEFTCNNDDINISASLTIIHYKFPMIRSSLLAEENLEKAKTHIWKNNKWINETEPSKNKITILGEVFNWNEFKYIKEFKEILVNLIEHAEQNKKESRALLQKVYNSTKGFNSLLKEAQNGQMRYKKYWRFAYYLRDMKTSNKSEKERLLCIYEKMVQDMVFENDDNRVFNPMIIPVAARWAELETKQD